GHADLPAPKPLGLRNLAGLIGPGIVMCGIQIGGGEWLFGPEVTAKYGGGLMWIATIAIITQAFYNIECGRYALYSGEPVFTGFMRTAPGPAFWIGVTLIMSLASLIPGLSTNAAVLIVTLWLDRPPTGDDAFLVNTISYITLGAVVLPVLIGGKVYNTLQFVMTIKVFTVLGFCLFLGIFFVGLDGWKDVFSGFLKFGNIPTKDALGNDTVTNAFTHFWSTGTLPVLALGNIAMLGAFAGYAGGGGLSNSTYSNFVRDKGWGMGGQVGAIASAVGGRDVSLSHVGKVFPITAENMKRWKGWWKYILADQLLVWVPGCFMGMALPALMSIQFAHNSSMFGQNITYSQPLIAADGIRQTASLGNWAPILWIASLLVGLMVFLPSQMSIVDDFARRWTDILWSGSRFARTRLKDNQVHYLYYSILTMYVVWSFIMVTIFLLVCDAPKLMVTVIANLNNVALAFTAFHILWINCRLLPEPLRPRWYQRLGMICCGVFYSSLALLVFWTKVLPMMFGK
ncbi:MAG: Nramp family divalent metal transporter, partial [Planctomycetota bacterium]|nr:Nramp family divalent metal transporter [Planctomycetota bacterium]